MANTQQDADTNLGGELPPSVLEGIVGGAKVKTLQILDGPVVEDLPDNDVGKNLKDIESARNDLLKAKAPKTVAGSYNKTTFTSTGTPLQENYKSEIKKTSDIKDAAKAADRYAIAQNGPATLKAELAATATHNKNTETLKNATEAHNAATAKVEQKTSTLNDVNKYTNDKPMQERAAKALDAATHTQNQTSADLDKAKTDASKSEKDLKAAQDAADAARAKQEELKAEDKKAKDGDKAKGAVGKTLGFVDKHIGTAVKYGGKILDKVAEEQAKKEGTLHQTTHTHIIAGGVPIQTTLEDGSQKTTFGHVVTESGTKSYNSSLGSGAKATWEVRAEAGSQVSKTEDLGNGQSKTDTTKTYAGASFENKAGFTKNATGVTAEASTSVSGHLEASKTTSFKDGDTTTTDSITGVVHGEAGAKVGGHIGWDGVAVNAKASAEIIAKVEAKHEVDYGGTKVHQTAEFYAQAKAEAQAQAEARIDLAKGVVKAKGSVGAELSAGIGATAATGAHSANGNGGDIGGGVYLGKLGGKVEADFDVKDGKLSATLELGAAIGIGINAKISIKGDLKAAKDGILDTAKVIKETPTLLKPFAVLGAGHIALYKGLKGFFS
jgi:hypothetical protein